MNWTYILFSICAIVLFLNLILTFFIGIFLVRFQQNLFNFVKDIETDPIQQEEHKEDKAKQKTWDQKYEEEMNALAERITRQNRGLTDL